MQISEFKKTLSENKNRNIRFVLPTGTKAPPQAHVTEVALIEKSSLIAEARSAPIHFVVCKHGFPSHVN